MRPRSLGEALEAINEDKVPYCGGTELLLAMRAGLTRPEALVDIKNIPELTGIRVDVDGPRVVVLGSVERHMDLAAHPVVREQLPMLAQVERGVGNARVRAQGSIGGNLCFAEPKSDVATALVAYGAEVSLISPAGARTVAVKEFVAGPYWADKQPEELLVDIRVPVPGNRTRAVYLKYQIAERPTLGVALLHDPDSHVCRLVVGALGEVQTLFTFADPGEIEPEAVAGELDPTPDLTGSELYKRHVAAVFIRRAMNALEEAA
ncbi:FAD binding domain-containing protein [Mycolicibacterium iranicum]|uniref:FAD binding domain-containing protein n=1 Tax=Mycolicibacterium iranicum TaxID=912594 RepID=UPI0013F4EA07|nr:FAD binding domain-containing protein [Mycolicibacterium iranicum]